MPMPRLVMTMTTGNVKLMAASCRAPSCATKKVSVALKSMMASTAQTMGTVMDTRCLVTGPSTRRAFEVVIAAGDVT